MATTKATAKTKKSQVQGDANDGPLLDSINAAVKKMIALGKQRGFVTYDELNAALPPEQVSSEQIEDTMSMLSESGVNVVENEESEEAGDNSESQKEEEKERNSTPQKSESFFESSLFTHEKKRSLRERRT